MLLSPRRRVPGAIALAIVTLLASLPRGAGADADSRARADALLRQGNALRRAGRERDALPFFQQAFAVDPTPRTHAQLATVLQAIGKLVEAEPLLKQALSVKSDPWILRHQPELTEQLEFLQKHLGSIEVVGGPMGAEIRVDDQPRGRLPLGAPIRVTAGEARITLAHPAYHRLVRVVQIAAGETLRLEAQLVAKEAGGSAPPPGLGDRARSLRSAGWVSLGLGLGMLGLGGGGVALRAQARDAFNGMPCVAGQLLPSCQQEKDRFDRGERMAIAGFAVGGALIVTATVLLLVSHRREPARLLGGLDL